MMNAAGWIPHDELDQTSVMLGQNLEAELGSVRPLLHSSLGPHGLGVSLG